jgi:hypothetical protein
MKIITLEVPDHAPLKAFRDACDEAKESLIAHSEICEDGNHGAHVEAAIDRIADLHKAFIEEARKERSGSS